MPHTLEPFTSAQAAEIANAMPVGLAIANGSGALLFVNTELARMTGYEPAALLGQPVEMLLPERLRGHHVADREAYVGAPTTRHMGAGRELFARRSDGSEFPVEVGLRPMETGGGRVTVATVIDVSERRRLESGFRAVVEAAPYGMILTDAQGCIALTNQRLRTMFGYTDTELLGQRVDMLLPERQRAGHVAHREAFFRAPEQRAMGGGRDLTGRRRDGVEIPVEVALSAITTGQGPMALAAVVDITERKRAELQLREANAQLEEFTYVASHDLRSPIRGIGNLLEFIREDYGDTAPAPVVRNLDRMDERVKRVESLIEDLLAYARAGRRSVKIERIDVAAVVADMLSLEPPPPGMRLEVDVSLPPFDGARTPLATVLRNLYANAIKHHDRPDGWVRIEAREGGNHCVISVADDGPGIPEAAQARVFRLFQTLTVAERQGGGLGLAVAKRLAEGHGGRIELTSADGQRGCSFRIWWPRFMRSDLDE